MGEDLGGAVRLLVSAYPSASLLIDTQSDKAGLTTQKSKIPSTANVDTSVLSRLSSD